MTHPALPTRLAMIAAVLALLAPFGTPYRGDVATVDLSELAQVVDAEHDHVTAEELAAWIVAGHPSFRLLDLRTESDYATYHIPGAERVPVAGLLEYPLGRNERIVLYSGGGLHAAQAWFLLRAKGYRGVYILLGGLEEWTRSILFPALPDASSPEGRRELERRRHLAETFGGQATVGGEMATWASRPPLPEVAAPPPVPRSPSRARAKEGC